jgi:hypothetical protein
MQKRIELRLKSSYYLIKVKAMEMIMEYNDKLREQIKDLTLMLLYLNSFREENCQCSWKGYDFNDLNKLAEEGFISQSRGTKSVVLRDDGIKKAEALCTQYGITLPDRM